MDFALTEQQQLLKKTVADFVKKECPKEYARELDEKEEFPFALWDKLAELGLMGLSIPEEYGGSGGDILDLIIVMEELSRGMTALGLAYFLSVCFGGKSIGFYGSEEQKKFYLSGLAQGKIKFALALTEPGGGTDILGALKTNAVPEGEDYILNGQKIFITGAHVADYLITVTRTDKNPPKKSLGLTIFIVDAKSPGIEIRPIKKLGIHATGSNEIFFEDVRVPAQNILGEKDKGWYQALQHMLADVATKIELSRLITYKAAWLQSQDLPCTLEAAMAKLFASEMAVEATRVGMQVLGGYSYTMEYDMQRYYRDAIGFCFAPISNEMSRNLIGELSGLPKSY